jgi:hypothetical protein
LRITLGEGLIHNSNNQFDEKDKKILSLEKEIQELESLLKQSEMKRLQCQDE